MNRLFEHVLTGHGAVHHLIREAQPGRTRSKVHDLLGTIALVLAISLGAVVQPEHDMIVLAASAFGHMKPRESRGRAWQGTTDAWKKGPRHSFEVVAHAPYAVRSPIHVTEHTQDALAVVRP